MSSTRQQVCVEWGWACDNGPGCVASMADCRTAGSASGASATAFKMSWGDLAGSSMGPAQEAWAGVLTGGHGDIVR